MTFDKPKKDEETGEVEEIYLSPETVAILKERSNGCFLCRFILEDQAKHGKLTDYPFDIENKGQFPVDAKMIHVQLERRSWENSRPPAPPGGARSDR